MSYDQFLLCLAVLQSSPGYVNTLFQLPFLTIKGHTSDFICQHSLVNIRLTVILCLRFLSVSKLQCQHSSGGGSRLSFDLLTSLPEACSHSQPLCTGTKSFAFLAPVPNILLHHSLKHTVTGSRNVKTRKRAKPL